MMVVAFDDEEQCGADVTALAPANRGEDIEWE